ncbi:MAG: hypothetical protein K0V04_42285 [Deltaproteobacteria bacterium]|nr:hypothetical protein [Deltaproteobacteria bacterium]
MSEPSSTDPFWSALPFEVPAASRPPTDVELQALWSAARAQHPMLGVDAAQYFQYLAQRCDRADVGDFIHQLDGPQLYLALACAHGDDRAVRRFEHEYFEEVRTGASRLRCAPDELDEITQRVREALFGAAPDGRAKLVHMTGRGDLRALVRLVALRAGISLRRRQGRLPADGGDGLVDVARLGDSPSLMLVKREHRERFVVALRAALATLDAKPRTVLRLREVDGLSQARLATMYRVDRSTITRWLTRARTDVLAETRRQLTALYGVGHHDFDSFVDVIRSNFAASIHRMLDEAASPPAAP